MLGSIWKTIVGLSMLNKTMEESKKEKKQDNNTDKAQTLIEHIEELRKVLIKCLIAIVIIFIPAFYLSPYCIDFLIKTIVKGKLTLNYFAPMEVFLIQLKISIVIDLLICFPFTWFSTAILPPREKMRP